MQFAIKIHQGIHQMIQNGCDEAALWALEKLVTDYPDFTPAHNDLAVMAHDRSDFQNALKHYRLAAEGDPHNFAFQKNYGDFLYAVEGAPEAALEYFAKALVIKPDDIDTLLVAGHLCTSLHRMSEAQSYYEKVMAIAPQHPTAKQYLASVFQCGFQNRSQADLSAAGLYEQAQHLIEQGDNSGAKDLLDQVVAQDPEFVSAYNDLGVMAFEAGDHAAALSYYEKAAGLAPDNIVFQKNLADFYFLIQNQPAAALKKYIQALTLDPTDIETILGCGRICMALSKVDDARDFFEKALEIEPWNEDARKLLEGLASPTKSGMPSFEDNPPSQSIPADVATGQCPATIQSLEQLVAQQPDNAAAVNDLGIMYYESGDTQKALAFYEKAVALDPGNSIFRKNLADYYYVEQGRTQDALQIYVKLLEEDPRDEDCLLAAGMICLSLDKADDSQVFFERLLEINPLHTQAKAALAGLHSTVDQQHRAEVIDFSRQMVG